MTVVTDIPAAKAPWWFGIVKPVLTGALRHGITALAGALVSVGAVQSDQTTQFVTIAMGIVTWLVGYAWSNYSHAVKTAQVVNAQAQTAAVQADNRAIVAETQRITGTEVPL